MDPQKTSIFPVHESLGARCIDFSGWMLPVQYESILKEHESVRTHAGIFDTSHMGQIICTGKDTVAFVNYLITNDLESIAPGKCLYSPILYENGMVVDDVIVYYYGKDKVLLVVNAANIQKDFEWFVKIAASKQFKIDLMDLSKYTSMIAIQGPKAFDFISKVYPALNEKMESFSFKDLDIDEMAAIFSTTGYTGEKGGELYLPNKIAPKVFKQFVEAGVVPCGLGARDTLRLEKGYSLYGHEIDETTNPLEAGLGWTVKLDKKDFVGKDALLQIKKDGLRKRLVGFVLEEKVVARQGAEVMEGDAQIGKVTSGVYSPTLKKNIGLAYIPYHYKNDTITLKVRDKLISASICNRVFVT